MNEIKLEKVGTQKQLIKLWGENSLLRSRIDSLTQCIYEINEKLDVLLCTSQAYSDE